MAVKKCWRLECRAALEDVFMPYTGEAVKALPYASVAGINRATYMRFTMAEKSKLALFIAGVVLIGWLIGWMNLPGDWYASLNKPSFNPPNWVFSPAWTVLYILIGATGWRVWVKTPDNALKTLWACQMALNFAWSPVFFGLQNITLGLLLITLLSLTITAFIWVAHRRDPKSAMFFVPYLAWVGFATLLNLEIFSLN